MPEPLNPQNTWVLEYSLSQKHFHISPYEAEMKNNHESYFHGTPSDWILLGLFASSQDASDYADKLKKKKDEMA